MSSTRHTLDAAKDHMAESMGLRAGATPRSLSPSPAPRDVGRRPLRHFGQVDIDKVMADPDQPREQFAQEGIERLAKSIREKGQLSPIRVRWSEPHAKWMIVAGERRWRATLRAGLPTIQCYFHEDELAPSEVLEQQLIENCLREDLRPTEEARALEKLIQLNGWNQKQLSVALRISPTRVTRMLALLKLDPETQRRVDAREISARSGYEISRLADPAARQDVAREATEKKLTSQQTAQAVRQCPGRRKSRPRTTQLTFLTEDGWKVVVSAKRKGCYEEVEQALQWALEEVQHRIRNRVQIF